MITVECIKKCQLIEVVGAINEVSRISTDSRKINKGEMFVALHGPTYDGADFAFEVAQKGASCLVLSHSQKNKKKAQEIFENLKVSVFLVPDALAFLQELALFYQQYWRKENEKRRIIGITGSNGKTTHKEMLFHLLNSPLEGKVSATRGNLNNHIGVPLTLLEIGDVHEVAIVEMGTNHPGEIQFLTKIAEPDCGIITNIGYAHIEFFGDQQGIFEEKRSLFDAVYSFDRKDPLFVVYSDDLYLAKLPKLQGVTFFGERSDDVSLEIIGDQYGFNFNNYDYNLNLSHVFGKHNRSNMLACFLLCVKLYPEYREQFIRGVKSYKAPENNRSQWVQKNDKRVYLDAYNANPGSMSASLHAFFKWAKDEKISLKDCLLVLGDMNELGEMTEVLHKEIAEMIRTMGFENVIYVGRFASFYKKGDFLGQMYESTADLKKDWNQLETKFKYFFLKGSRTLQLETLLDINSVH